MAKKVEIKLAERDCICRSCDKQLYRGKDEVAYTYSFRGRGTRVILCEECVDYLIEQWNKRESIKNG